MKTKMTVSALVGLSVLAACSPVKNHVVVDATGSPDLSGVVSLCGRDTNLTRQGDRLSAAVSITCEGDGEVRLRFQNGSVATCQIGYVTPGAAQRFSFALKNGACV
jgi:hypothetical protein